MNRRSRTLFEQANTLIPGGVNSPVRAFQSVGGTPFFSRSGKGAILSTVDGRELVDLVCSWGSAIFGHNHPSIKKSIADALEHGTSFGTPNPYEVELAELVISFVPSIQKVRMCSSGTEATMSAIRLARGYTGFDKIIKFAGCYHGHSDSLLIKAGSGALTHGQPDSAGVPSAVAQNTIILPFNNAEQVEAAFKANQGQIAAVILEPYCGNMGFVIPDHGYLATLREITRREGALLIFDEVMTGFRLAKGGVQEIEGIQPDLTCLGKILGGGLPVAAFGGRAEIMDHLAPLGNVYQAGTLSGNPLAMAAGVASLRILRDVDPYAKLDSLGRMVQSAVMDAAQSKGVAVQVPQCGSMFSIFFSEIPIRDYASALQTDISHYRRFFHLALESGVYFPPSAFEACFLSLAHEGQPIDLACEVINQSILRL